VSALFFCVELMTILFWLEIFYLPSINWANFEAPYDDIHDVFLDFCVQHKMVKECTRDNNICIDLVLTNDVFMVLNMNVVTPFRTSDHCMVDFELLLDQTGSEEVSMPTPTECYYDHDNADIQCMVNFLWNHSFRLNSEIWSNYSDINVCSNDSVVKIFVTSV